MFWYEHFGVVNDTSGHGDKNFFFLAFNNYENRQDYDIVDIVDQSNLDTALYCSQSLDIYNSHRLAHKYDQKFHISMRLADVLWILWFVLRVLNDVAVVHSLLMINYLGRCIIIWLNIECSLIRKFLL